MGGFCQKNKSKMKPKDKIEKWKWKNQKKLKHPRKKGHGESGRYLVGTGSKITVQRGGRY